MAFKRSAQKIVQWGTIIGSASIITWYMWKGEEKKSGSGISEATHEASETPWPRQRLVDCLHVETPTSSAFSHLIPKWLGKSFLSQLREGERKVSDVIGPPPRPPLIFVACADPFVIENLVSDAFEKRYVKSYQL